MDNIEDKIYKNIYICIQNKKVYLINKLTILINELTYSTFSMVSTDDQIGVSSAPHYRIQNIPATQAVYLETLDGWEDGSIYYQLENIKTSSFTYQKSFTFNQKKLSGMISLPPLAKCSIEKITSDASFVVNLPNKDTMNKLYWIAEELKAYTDLTGDRFDIDNAQRRLFPMQSILEKNDLPKIKKLYDELMELLETPMFFDKASFSEKVDQFYSLSEKLKS